MNTNDNNAIAEIKALALDMISQAKSGYPGIVLSGAPILYTLYARHMHINPGNPDWLNRDRFVLSSSHASALFYATLHMCGFNITKDDLKQYRSIDSKLPGSLEYEITPGVDISVGTPGMGIANAVGMALAERYIENILISEDESQTLIDYRTYVYCSDIDLMKGVSYEAASFAGAQKLEKLMILCDVSKVTNDGSVSTHFIEDIKARFEAMGFFASEVKDTENLKNIDKAITTAKKSKKPSIIIFNTILGSGSRNENNNVSFEGPLSDDDIFAIKRKLNITIAPFEVRKDSFVHVKNLINERVGKKYNEHVDYFNKIKSSANDRLLNVLRLLTNKDFQIPFESLNFKVGDTYSESLLLTNHKILNMVASKSEFVLGGSADMASTTKAYISNTSIQTPEKPLGRNMNFGLREEAMAGILNGMSISGMKTYASTKLINADSMKVPMRMSALMNLPITYIFTHDGFGTCEDGASSIPVEQLTSLRSIPNMITFRPSDINEVLGTWEYICKNKKTVSVVLSKNVMPKLPNTHPKMVMRGGYIVKKEERKLDGIIIATGKELLDALNIAIELRSENLDIRVVSMPSMELFLKEDKTYQEGVLPKGVKTIVIEPSSKLGWGLFVSDEKYILGLNDFGYSGHEDEVLKKCGYDYENLKMKVARLLVNP